MTESNEKNISLINSIYFSQIDFLKGLAIISVILLHTIPSSLLIKTYSQFYIWQAVPIFFILMGFNSGISFSRKKYYTIRQFYSKEYLMERFWRLLAPFLIIFLISLFYGIYNGKYYIGFGYLIGLLPVSGPGNFFISILFQYIFIAPFIFILYKKSPKFMLVTLFLIDILFQIIVPHIPIFNENQYLYSASIFRYFSALALGFYIFEEYLKNGFIDIMSNKNRFILFGSIISIFYLFLARFTKQPFPLFSEIWGSQNVISFFYPSIIIIFILNSNFNKYDHNFIYSIFLEMGKASYHIFLVQILFFGFGLSFVNFITKDNLFVIGPFAMFANLIITLTIGWIFYFSQKNIKKRYFSKNN